MSDGDGAAGSSGRIRPGRQGRDPPGPAALAACPRLLLALAVFTGALRVPSAQATPTGGADLRTLNPPY